MMDERQKNRVQTKVMVKVLDFHAIPDQDEKCMEFLANQEPCKERKVLEVSYGQTIGIVETPNGMFVIDTDAVVQSKPLSKENPWNIPVLGTYAVEGSTAKSKDVFPRVSFNLTPESLKDVSQFGETLNLAEFVRTFGFRLEYNYDVARKHLEKMMEI